MFMQYIRRENNDNELMENDWKWRSTREVLKWKGRAYIFTVLEKWKIICNT